MARVTDCLNYCFFKLMNQVATANGKIWPVAIPETYVICIGCQCDSKNAIAI